MLAACETLGISAIRALGQPGGAASIMQDCRVHWQSAAAHAAHAANAAWRSLQGYADAAWREFPGNELPLLMLGLALCAACCPTPFGIFALALQLQIQSFVVYRSTCSEQQRSRGSGSGKTFDGRAAFSRLSTSDHRRKDAQCIRYASGGSVATRTCVGWQRGLPGRRRAWQVQVALNRCYYMLNRRRRLTSATPSVLGDAICAPRGECGAGSRCMQDLMKRGERRTALC